MLMLTFQGPLLYNIIDTWYVSAHFSVLVPAMKWPVLPFSRVFNPQPLK